MEEKMKRKMAKVAKLLGGTLVVPKDKFQDSCILIPSRVRGEDPPIRIRIASLTHTRTMDLIRFRYLPPDPISYNDVDLLNNSGYKDVVVFKKNPAKIVEELEDFMKPVPILHRKALKLLGRKDFQRKLKITKILADNLKGAFNYGSGVKDSTYINVDKKYCGGTVMVRPDLRIGVRLEFDHSYPISKLINAIKAIVDDTV